MYKIIEYMKKALFLTMLLTSLWANAKDVLVTSYGNDNHEVVSQIITYELDDATSEASVKRIEVFSTHVVIPSNIEDNGRSYRVVSIGDGEDQSSLVRIDDNISTFSIELPTTCSSIGNYAFYKVSQLVSITGLEGIYEIGNYAFCETSLTSLVLPQRISEYIMVLDGDIVIGDYAFYRCPITTLSLGSTKSIGDYGFSGITLSGTLYIPVTMCIIGDHAFEDCPNIQIVQFGTQRIGIDSQKVRRIGDFAFSRCESLEILYMLSGYAYCWGQSICASCPNLENYSDAHIGDFQDYSNNVHHNTDVTHHNTFDHGLLIHGIGTNDTIVSSLPKYNGIPSAIESGMYYKNVKYISSMALSYYPTKSLSINAAHLGTYVLFNSEIEEVTFGKDVEAIDGEPFLQCGKLKKVTCLSTTPPVIPVSPWNHDDVTLFVPAGCNSAYQNATYWNQFGTIKEILITDIKMENSEERLHVGATKQLNLIVEGGIASPETIEWSTTDKSIATVNIEGLITAIKEGVATITAIAKDGSGVSASCTVTVVSGDDDTPSDEIIPSTNIANFDNVLYFNDVEHCAGDFNLELNLKCAEENITAFQCDIFLPEGVTWKSTTDKRGNIVYDQPTFNEDRTDESYHSISPIAQNADGSYRMIVYSMANEIILETDGAILTLPLSISEEMEAGDYNLIIKGIVVTDVNKQQTLVDKVVSRLTIPSYTLGDVNGDDMINVTDVVSVIAYILGDHSSDFIFPAGDINEDGVINVTDVVSIIDIILNSHADPAAAKLMGVHKTLASGDTSNLEIIPFAIAEGTSSSTVKLNLNNPGDEFTAFQCDIQLPEGIDWEYTVDKRGNVKYTTPVFDSEADRTDASYHTVSVQKTDGIFRVIVYSMANETILDEEGAVLDIPFVYADDIASGVYDVSIKNVVLTRVNKTDVKPADYTFSVLVGSPTESAIALNGNFTDEAINEYNTVLAANITVAAIDLSNAVDVSSNTAFATGNKNLVLYVANDVNVKNTNNVVVGDECANLVITDGYNFAAPVEFTAASASYEREMTTTWGTIVLPFDVVSDENTVYYLPTEVEGSVLKLTRQEVLPANTPALVENVSGSGIAVSVTNVDVVDDLQPSVNNSVTMYGSYANGVRIDNPSAYYINNDKFWLCNEYFYANAFRSYFTVAGSAAKTLSIIAGDGVTTGVDGVNTNNVEGYYDLSGKRFDSLQKGVNIVKTKTGESYKVIVE